MKNEEEFKKSILDNFKDIRKALEKLNDSISFLIYEIYNHNDEDNDEEQSLDPPDKKIKLTKNWSVGFELPSYFR